MSPRPKKPRNCSCPFRAEHESVFKPAGTPLKDLVKTKLEHDELEALHLCDSLGMTQQQAGDQMGISRGTVQRLVVSGRKKVIDALTTPQALLLEAASTTDESSPG